MVQLSHPYMTTGKTITLTKWTFVGKVMSLLFNILSRLVTAFLPRSKHLLISWLQWLSAVILEPKKIKSVIVSTFSPSTCHEVMGPDTIILVFWMLSFKPAFSLCSFTFIKRLFSFSLPLVWYHLHIWTCWCNSDDSQDKFLHLPAFRTVLLIPHHWSGIWSQFTVLSPLIESAVTQPLPRTSHSSLVSTITLSSSGAHGHLLRR